LTEERLSLVCQALEDPVAQAELILRGAFLARATFSGQQKLLEIVGRAPGDVIGATLSLTKPSSTRGAVLRFRNRVIVCVGGRPANLEELCREECGGTISLYSMDEKELAKILGRVRADVFKILEEWAETAAPLVRGEEIGARAPEPPRPLAAQQPAPSRPAEVPAPQAVPRPAPPRPEERAVTPPRPRSITEVPLNDLASTVRELIGKNLGVDTDPNVSVQHKVVRIKVPPLGIGLRIVASAVAEIFELFNDIDRVEVEFRKASLFRRQRETLTQKDAGIYKLLAQASRLATNRGFKVIDGSASLGRGEQVVLRLHVGVEVKASSDEYMSRLVLLSKAPRDEIRRLAEDLARTVKRGWRGSVRVLVDVSAIQPDGSITPPLLTEEAQS